jgi:hypothetical protein
MPGANGHVGQRTGSASFDAFLDVSPFFNLNATGNLLTRSLLSRNVVLLGILK